MTGVIIRDRKGEDTQGEADVKTEAEDGVLCSPWLQPRMPAATRNWKRQARILP